MPELRRRFVFKLYGRLCVGSVLRVPCGNIHRGARRIGVQQLPGGHLQRGHWSAGLDQVYGLPRWSVCGVGRGGLRRLLRWPLRLNHRVGLVEPVRGL